MSDALYDPLSDQTLANPFPVYSRLRETRPVYWHEGMRSWVVSRYKDCMSVLLQHEVFAGDWRRVGEEIPASSMSIQSLDPPEQRRIRQLVMNGFHEQDLDALGSRAFQLSRDILQRHTGAPAFDLVEEVAVPMALDSISRLLGVPTPDRRSFVAISDAIVDSMDEGLRPEVGDAGTAARVRLSELVHEWFEAKPERGLIGYLVRHRDPALVPEDVVVNTTRVMFQAGYSSLSVAAGNAALALLENPESLRSLAANPEQLDTAVDELMRYDGPVQGTSRVCVTDTELGGQVILRGQVVVVLFASANHDPEQFTTPESLVLNRNPNPHLGFGWGPHVCTGSLHAKIALAGFVRSLVSLPVFPVLAGKPVRHQRATVRCLQSLPLTLAG
nr:putative cytochrome P450 hydroxylase [Kibdelosporangium sp. MJ126-NF4]CTQ90587.1 putative cytochrome P450 hydroxylase [Kibdelosporangium sp. MJ126-NF4]